MCHIYLKEGSSSGDVESLSPSNEQDAALLHCTPSIIRERMQGLLQCLDFTRPYYTLHITAKMQCFNVHFTPGSYICLCGDGKVVGGQDSEVKKKKAAFCPPFKTLPS